jgi:hypothetical protein
VKPERRETAGGVSKPDVPSASEPARAKPWTPRPAEPYQEGNTAALTHGAYSPSLVTKTAEEIWADMEEQLEQMPGYMAADRILVDELREVVSQLVLLRRHRAEKGVLDEKGDPRSFVWLEDKLGRRLVDLAKALGLGTTERAKVFGAFMAAGRAHAEALAAQQRIRDRLKAPRRKKAK